MPCAAGGRSSARSTPPARQSRESSGCACAPGWASRQAPREARATPSATRRAWPPHPGGGAPNGATVDSATREHASAQFSFEPAGDGFFELRGPLATATPEPRAPAALVGRTGERALLRALAERAAHGTRAAVLVRGQAGVGKTRLLEALADTARDDLGMTLLHCVSSAYHRGSRLHPLLAGLRRHWQLAGAQASARLAQRAGVCPAASARSPLLAERLGVALPDAVAPLPEMSARRRRRESLAVLATRSPPKAATRRCCSSSRTCTGPTRRRSS